MEIPEPAVADTSSLQPCPICGRTFRPDALERHHKVCQKTAEKKRKVFDSKKQRVTGTDIPSKGEAKPATKTPPSKSKVGVKKTPPPKPKPKSNWREKHEDLINTIRKSREPENTDTAQVPEPKSRVPSDYVQCPSCERHFNQKAAERHIEWCQQKKATTPKSPATDEAKEKLNARVKYRVPPPGKVKKVIRKPKTAGFVPKTENRNQVERENGSHSSPPSLVDTRNNKSRASNGKPTNGNQSRQTKREPRNGSRGRDNKSCTPPDIPHHILKFKEKFPNHCYKRGVDLEESFSSEQLRELLSSTRITNTRCPRTVPGVRLSGGHQTSTRNPNENWNYRSAEVTNSGSSSGDSVGSWSKRLLDDSALPEVSSSELPSPWTGKLCWNGDLEASLSSSGSSSSGSLPPLSRESPSDGQVVFYCHQCSHKFPLIAAKYCCECGAKRRGIGAVSQNG